jgi:hypothetical protein
MRARLSSLFLISIAAACGAERPVPPSGPTSKDAGPGADARADDAGSPRDGGLPSDAGSPDDAAAPPADAGVNLEGARNFRQQVARAVCAKLDSCCTSADRDIFFGQFRDRPYELMMTPSPADCERVLADTLGKLHDKWLPSVARGAISFDAAKAARCVASVEDARCGIPVAEAFFGGDCWGPRGKVFSKRRALGESCENIGDTTYYGECDPALGFCGNVSKVCEPWRRTGEECTIIGTWAFCAPMLNCDGAAPGRPGRCSAPPITVALGGGCTALSGPTTLCAEDAFCNYSSERCEPKKPDGAACQQDGDCSNSHPLSCWPFGGGGTCGGTVFCSGGGR